MKRLAAGIAALCLAISGHGRTLAAQQAAPCSPVPVEAGHWSVEATHRLEAEGFVEAQLVSRTPTLCRVRQLFEEASAESTLAAGFLDRLDREIAFRDTPVGLGWAQLEGRALVTADRTAPGFGEFEPERTGALPIADEATLAAGGAAGIEFGRRIALVGEVRTEPATKNLQRLELVGRAGGLAFALGRGSAGMGYSPRGAVVVHEVEGLDRLRIETEAPFTLPSILRHIGPVGLSGFLGRLDEPRHQKRPYFLGGALSVRPHSRLTFAVHRGAMFGGEGVEIGADDLLNMLIGRVAGIGFENQIVSLQGTWRLPTESVVPLTAYFDWGAEDAAGSWTHVPGQLWGISMPRLPGLPNGSLALEFTRFAESCCFNPEWYRHQSFLGSWASGDRPLGHPLGGHGSEFSVVLQSWGVNGRFLSEAELFARKRDFENLYAPGRAGRSIGADVDLSHDLEDRLRVQLRGALEAGDGWTERMLEAAVFIFP